MKSFSLPIDPYLTDISAAFKSTSRLILTATPGAGKTTRLPPHLLNSIKGKIAVLEPRRMATVAASHHVAEENSWKLGTEVGYQVRFESRVSAATRLIYMTDALFLRRLTEDPELSDFDLIVIDEFHERNLNQDLTLGIIKELQDMGRDIKLLVMSATLDVNHLLQFLPESRHIDIPGKVFPLEVTHAKEPLRLATDREFIDRVGSAVLAHENNSGDILVFLPGVGEIQRTQEFLELKRCRRDIVPLHGSLTLQQQKAVLKPAEAPRVILATNIAEASVTVPGVNLVIDSGLAKVMQVHLKSGFGKMELQRIAQFNARQRAGRAARQQPGRCLRLWTSFEETSQALEMPPECVRVDLASSLLLLARLGVTDFLNFSWLTPPPPILVSMAVSSLKLTRALDSEHRLTERGQNLLRFPLPPRWSSLLVLAEEVGGTDIACDTAALLQDKDIFAKGTLTSSTEECDLQPRLQALSSTHTFPRGLERVREASEQLRRLVTPRATKDEHILSRLLIRTQSDRLCRRRGASDRGLMVGGRGVKLAAESSVRTRDFFIALDGIDLPGQPDSTISLASGLTKNFLFDELKDQIVVREDTYFDDAKGQFYLRKVRCFKDLELEDPQLTRLATEDLGDRFIDLLTARWPWLIENNESLKSWMARWRFFQTAANQDDPLTPALIRDALQMASFNQTRIDGVVSQNLVSFIEGVLDRDLVRRFHREVPARFEAPSGGSHPIIYEGDTPYVEVRLQEMFGLTKTPTVGPRQIPLTLRLLAPNFRPVQVTADIEGFWQRAYVDVRKELRGRYPKHSWPDDPLTAIPVAKGRRRN